MAKKIKEETLYVNGEEELKKEKILEAKYKGDFINANIEDLCNRSFMSKQLLSLSRRENFNTENQQEHFLKTWE